MFGVVDIWYRSLENCATRGGWEISQMWTVLIEERLNILRYRAGELLRTINQKYFSNLFPILGPFFSIPGDIACAVNREWIVISVFHETTNLPSKFKIIQTCHFLIKKYLNRNQQNVN